MLQHASTDVRGAALSVLNRKALEPAEYLPHLGAIAAVLGDAGASQGMREDAASLISRCTAEQRSYCLDAVASLLVSQSKHERAAALSMLVDHDPREYTRHLAPLISLLG